jgi:hypothetical protein
MKETFLPMVEENKAVLPEGKLAVVYDKNDMEASGYAAALAEVSQETVLLATFYQDDTNPPVKFVNKVMHIRDENGEWHAIRAAFRYVTQRPWDRLLLDSKVMLCECFVNAL